MGFSQQTFRNISSQKQYTCFITSRSYGKFGMPMELGSRIWIGAAALITAELQVLTYLAK